eukprot:Awhi_evm1s1894
MDEYILDLLRLKNSDGYGHTDYGFVHHEPIKPKRAYRTLPDAQRTFLCEFQDCDRKYTTNHSRRQHYRKFHNHYSTSKRRRRKITTNLDLDSISQQQQQQQEQQRHFQHQQHQQQQQQEQQRHLQQQQQQYQQQSPINVEDASLDINQLVHVLNTPGQKTNANEFPHFCFCSTLSVCNCTSDCQCVGCLKWCAFEAQKSRCHNGLDAIEHSVYSPSSKSVSHFNYLSLDTSNNVASQKQSLSPQQRPQLHDYTNVNNCDIDIYHTRYYDNTASKSTSPSNCCSNPTRNDDLSYNTMSANIKDEQIFKTSSPNWHDDTYAKGINNNVSSPKTPDIEELSSKLDFNANSSSLEINAKISDIALYNTSTGIKRAEQQCLVLNCCSQGVNTKLNDVSSLSLDLPVVNVNMSWKNNANNNLLQIR